MRKRRLGKTDIDVSVVVFGGWQAGKSYWTDVDDHASVAAHRAAFEGGITTFDTAEVYGDGHSETILAQALGSHREELVICTKVSWDHLAPDALVAACEGSLRRLGTDRVELLYIHWPAGSWGSARVPVADTLGAMARLKEQGKIRAIGVSNVDATQLAAAQAVTRIDALQPCWSLLWRHPEVALVPACVAADITVFGYSTLAQGLLTGKLGAGWRPAPGDNRRDNKLFAADVFPAARAVAHALAPIAAERGLSVAQLALAWLAHQPQACAIAGARTPAQAADNAGAGDVALSAEACAAVEAIARPVSDRFVADPLMWTWQV